MSKIYKCSRIIDNFPCEELNPDNFKKGRFSVDEDVIILKHWHKFGKSWKRYNEYTPLCRTPSSIRHRLIHLTRKYMEGNVTVCKIVIQAMYQYMMCLTHLQQYTY